MVSDDDYMILCDKSGYGCDDIIVIPTQGYMRTKCSEDFTYYRCIRFMSIKTLSQVTDTSGASTCLMVQHKMHIDM